MTFIRSLRRRLQSETTTVGLLSHRSHMFLIRSPPPPRLPWPPVWGAPRGRRREACGGDDDLQAAFSLWPSLTETRTRGDRFHASFAPNSACNKR